MDSHRKNRMGAWLRRLLVAAAALVGVAIVLAAVELLGSRGLPARSAPPGAFTALRATVDSVPGLAIAIADESGLRAQHGWGDADLDASRRVEPDTLFRVYSLAKPITAVAALALAERSELELDAPVSRYVSSLPQHLGAASLRQLLAHVAGVRHYDDGEWLPWSQEHCARPIDALPRFINAPLVAAPGESFLYSSFGYVLVSAAIEKAAGQPLLAVLRRTVFDPAGMTSTTWEHEAQPARLTSFYEPAWLGRVDVARPVDNSCKWGAGGLVSSASDLARFGSALAAGRLLNPESLAAMLRPWTLPSGETTGYGLGWGVTSDASGAVVATHSGGAIGGRAAIRVRLKPVLAVAIATNIESDSLLDEAHEIAKGFE